MFSSSNEMTVGFVNSAPKILLHCAWQGHYETAETRRFVPCLPMLASQLAGQLGNSRRISVYLQAFGLNKPFGQTNANEDGNLMPRIVA
jgi:hypothetical protein